jgi:hypothetical protein
MSQIYIQFDAGRRLLACGFFPPPGLVGLSPGQTGSVWTALVLGAPAHLTSCQVADLFLATKIDPPCFQVSFADLGPGWRITGRAITLTEAASITGHPRNTLLAAVRRGDLPTFRAGKGNREHMVNSLDLDRYMASPGSPHGRPRKPASPPAPPKKRGRPPKKKPG